MKADDGSGRTVRLKGESGRQTGEFSPTGANNGQIRTEPDDRSINFRPKWTKADIARPTRSAPIIFGSK